MQEFRTNDNVTLRYIDTAAGKLEELSKPVLLLLHGWTGSSAVFRKNIPAFSQIYRVIAPDIRGHGQSQKPDFGYHVSRLAMDLRELILHLQQQNESIVHIKAIGTSLGCAILWSYAELFTTDVFSHLVFVDQSPLQNKADDWDEQFCNRGLNSPAALAELKETLASDPEAAHLGTINGCLGYRWKRLADDVQTEQTWKQDREFFLAEAMKGNQKWFGQLMADHTALDWRDSIKATMGGSQSKSLVLVVASSRSGCFPAAGPLKVVDYVNEKSSTGVRRARGVSVEWGGHWCYWEKSELFNELVLDFMET